MCVEKERLDQAQAKLKERGYKDTKFFFSPIGSNPLSKVALEAAAVLEAMLEGRTKEFKPFGDSVRN